MQSVTGVVQEVRVKNTSVGDMFDIIVNGAEYGAGKFRPVCKPGDTVMFNVTYRGKFANVDTRSMQVTGSSPHDGAPPPPVAPSRGNLVPKMSTQDVISRQCASNTAIAWIEVLVQAQAIPLPAKLGVRNAIMDEILEKYKHQFLAWNTGLPTPENDKENETLDDTTNEFDVGDD